MVSTIVLTASITAVVSACVGYAFKQLVNTFVAAQAQWAAERRNMHAEQAKERAHHQEVLAGAEKMRNDDRLALLASWAEERANWTKERAELIERVQRPERVPESALYSLAPTQLPDQESDDSFLVGSIHFDPEFMNEDLEPSEMHVPAEVE